MAKEERSSGLTPKLVLAFACMALLVVSLPSGLSTMNAGAQNSMSRDSLFYDASLAKDNINSMARVTIDNSTINTANSSQPIRNSTSAITVANTISTTDVVSENTTSLVTISGEPLLPSDKSITRSFSYALLKFQGEVAAELTVTITWNTDGTTSVSDNRGYQYTIGIPASQGIFSLWSNSTIVDQRIVSPFMQYDVYWTALPNDNGSVDKYKYTIAGRSVNGSTISFVVDGGNYDEFDGTRFFVGQPASTAVVDTSGLDPALDWTAPSNVNQNTDPIEEDTSVRDGLELDWSDVVAAGYNVYIDNGKSSIDIPVGESFVIDPYIVGTSSNYLSPQIDTTSEGQVRLLTTFNSTTTRINAFYYDGSNIVYRTSDDEGTTWSSAISTGSGTLASDIYRWTLVGTIYNNNTYVSLLYFSPSGNNTNFYAIRGTVSGTSISWGSPILLGYTAANTSACGSGGSCAAVTAAPNSNGTIFAAFRYRSGGSSTYSYQIMKSSDGGQNWSVSLPQVDGFSTSRISMALTDLNSTKMLFIYAKSASANLFYRVYDGSAWGSEQTVTITGLATGLPKQLSAKTGYTQSYVAYTNVTSTGGGGVLKMAIFSNTGVFDHIETADSTLRHNLPNIIFSSNGDININTISNGKVYNTRKTSDGIWEAPFNPYGDSFTSPNMLTATSVLMGENGALWTEGSSSPYTIKFDYLEHGLVQLSNTAQNAPGYSDYFEGERRVIDTINGTQFAFYYDGSNIVYKTSKDSGHTWSSAAVSTGTGTIGSDYYRWTIKPTYDNGTDRVVLLYFTTSGGSTTYYAKTFSIIGRVLSLVSTGTLFSVTNDASCTPTGVCAAASAALDFNSTVYAAFSYKTGGIWYKRVMRSNDAGATWTTSLSATSITTTGSRLPITITSLDSGKMLLAWGKYDSSWMWYKVYNGSSWQPTQSISNIGWSTNTVKQISSDTLKGYATNGTVEAYVAYLSSGNHGDLKVARFDANGTYLGVETADNTIDHWTPALSISNDDLVRVFTLSGGTVYQTIKNMTSGWQAPVASYTGLYYSPDQLTAQIAGPGSSGALWSEGSASPYTIAYAGVSTPVKRIDCSIRADKSHKCTGSETYLTK